MYGLNGLHIRTNMKIFMSYQMSKLLYGLEVLPLLKSDKDALDLYHHTVLKTCSTYHRVHQHQPCIKLPASAILASNILTLYVNMIRDPASVERLIIQRQLAVKGKDSKSWIMTVKDLLHHYDLPSSYDLYTNPPSKRQWKCTLKDKITRATFSQFREETRRMVSLLHMNIDACKPGTLRPVWGTVKDSRHVIVRTCPKVRVQTGQYRLQSDVAKQSGDSRLSAVPPRP